MQTNTHTHTHTIEARTQRNGQMGSGGVVYRKPLSLNLLSEHEQMFRERDPKMKSRFDPCEGVRRWMGRTNPRAFSCSGPEITVGPSSSAPTEKYKFARLFNLTFARD